MEITTFLYVLLFIPFGLLFLIFGLVYMITGYKKDLAPSLVSLVATIVAIPVSLLLSKLFAWLLSPALMGLLTDMLPADRATASVLQTVAAGVMQIVLSLFLFVLLFILFLAIAKAIGKKHIHWSKLDALNSNTPKTKLAGMGLRFADALLVVIMLLLPLYGTIAMTVPAASSLLELASVETSQSDMQKTRSAVEAPAEEPEVVAEADSDAQIRELLAVVENHPVLLPYKYGPGDWVYSGLSSFSMNGNTADVSRAAEVMTGLVERLTELVAAFESEDNSRALAAADELVSYTKAHVIEERWFYELFMGLVKEFDKAFAQYTASLPMDGDTQAELALVYQIRPLLDMTYEEFKSNGSAILEFLEHFLDADRIRQLTEIADVQTAEEAIPVLEDVTAQVGKLVNHSPQAAAMKRILLATWFDTDWELADPNAPFVNWDSGLLTDPEQQKLEGLQFCLLLMGNDGFDALPVLAMNPLFGGDVAASLLNEQTVADQLENRLYGYSEEELAQKIAAQPQLLEQLQTKLRSYSQQSLNLANCVEESVAFTASVYETMINGLGLEESFSGPFDSSSIHITEDGSYVVSGDGTGENTVHIITGGDGSFFVSGDGGAFTAGSGTISSSGDGTTVIYRFEN